MNLAPVADVVPAALRNVNAPIGRLRRGYGSDPDVVARKVAAFVRGMDAADVATAVKHFPGLGRVRGNTDFEADVVDGQTRRDDPGLAGFRAAVEAGVDMVMIASARYRQDRPRASGGLLTDRDGDDPPGSRIRRRDHLRRPARPWPSTTYRLGARALRFLRAGGDLAIVGDPVWWPRWRRRCIDEARDDPAFAGAVAAKATRVVTLKARRGLADC